MAASKQIDEQGETAKRLYKKLTDSSKDYNERRREQREELREALAPVWAALEDGRAVNGWKDKLSWCRWVNPTAKHPERYFYMVMQDKKGLKSLQSAITVTVKPGMNVVIDGIRYKVPELKPNLRKTIADHHKAKGTDGFNVILVGLQAVIRQLRKREQCPECSCHADVKDGKFGKHGYLPGPKKGDCAMSGRPVVLNERGRVINTSQNSKKAAAA
jgi:hypothetical protein